MRIYLDVSCLNRPFDDQSQPRIRLEAEAVTVLFEKFDAARWRQVSSDMARIEIAAISDVERRRRVRALLPSRVDIIGLTAAVFRRASELEAHGIKPADAVHVAAAEAARADALLTCDDRLLRRGRRLRKELRVRIANPIDWLQEYLDAPDA